MRRKVAKRRWKKGHRIVPKLKVSRKFIAEQFQFEFAAPTYTGRTIRVTASGVLDSKPRTQIP